MKRITLLLFAAMVFFVACKEEELPTPTPGPIVENPILEARQILSNLRGVITDENGQVVENATSLVWEISLPKPMRMEYSIIRSVYPPI